MKRTMVLIVVFMLLTTSYATAASGITLTQTAYSGVEMDLGLIYTDISGHWAETAVIRWSDYGVLSSYDGLFKPNAPVTRAELAAVIDNVMIYQDISNQRLSDVSPSSWCYIPIMHLISAGVMSSVDNMAAPDRSVTREEAAVMFARAFYVPDGAVEQSIFTDASSISSWAAQAVQGMKDEGFMGGLPDGSFAPRKIITRAEVATILDKMIDYFYQTPGEYDNQGISFSPKNVVINTGGVTLKNTAVTGNLYITPGAGSGITLENVTVAGTTFLIGIEPDLVAATDCDLNIRIVDLPAFENRTDVTGTISAGGDHSMAVKADGTLWTWGSNEYGVLGNGKANVIGSFNPEDRFDEYVPIQILDNVASVSAGRFHNMAIRTDGSLWAWGNNEQGQLGDGTKTVRAYDDEGFPYYAEMNDKHVPIRIMDDVAKVSAGTHHTLALKTDGTLWAWGWNDRGQLGTGSTEDSYIPVQIMSDVISISAGSKHSLAVKSDGTLWAWGSNTSGQIGDGTRTLEYLDENYNLITTENNDKLKPVQIMDDALMVSAGEGYSMAIKADGTLYAWGNNMNGKLGNGFMTVLDDSGKPKEDHNEVLPVQVMNEAAFVSAGGTHCLAVKNDGTLWAWGWNFLGQIGDGTGIGEDISVLAPVQIMDNIAAMSAGFLHNVAVKKDGTLWTWGFNNVGQLGDGTTTGWTENGTYNNRNSTVPIKIMTLLQ